MIFCTVFSAVSAEVSDDQPTKRLKRELLDQELDMKCYMKYGDSRQQICSSSRLGSQDGKDRLYRHIQYLTRPILVNKLTRWLRSACGNKWYDLTF